MADEEAEQESGSLGGDLLELRRLRERLVELETGLRESSEPAVQAATEYCKQLCQVRPPLPFLPCPRPRSPLPRGVCVRVCPAERERGAGREQRRPRRGAGEGAAASGPVRRLARRGRTRGQLALRAGPGAAGWLTPPLFVGWDESARAPCAGSRSGRACNPPVSSPPLPGGRPGSRGL